MSQVPPCRGGGSARDSHAPLPLHVRRHGTALPLHDRCGWSDGCRRAVWPQARQAVHTRWPARAGSPRRGREDRFRCAPGHLRNCGLRCVRVNLCGPFRRCRPRPPFHAASSPAGVASTGVRFGHGPANRAPLARASGRRELRDRSQSDPFGAGAARAHACGHSLRAIAESLPTPDLAKRAWTNPRGESRSADKPCPEGARGIEAVDSGARDGPGPGLRS